MPLKSYFLGACLLIFIHSQAQYRNTILDKVMNYPDHFDNVKDFSYRVGNDYSDQEDQAQAIFTWIAKNIAYDLDYYYSLKPANTIFFRSEEERIQQIKQVKNQIIVNTLKKKKGICNGYANLLKAVCDELKIPNVIIHGYTKLNSELINTNPTFKNHTWNAVYYNSSWHLMDVTWAAGYQLYNTKKWVFNFNRNYYDQDPSKFIKHHFPEDSNWQLLNIPLTKDEFFANPIFYDKYFSSGIEIDSKQSGSVLKQENDKFVYLYFKKLPNDKQNILALTRTSLTSKKIRFTKNKDDTFTAKIKVKANPDFLTIYYKNEAVLNFQVIINYVQ